jgi:hypothetical protein
MKKQGPKRKTPRKTPAKNQPPAIEPQPSVTELPQAPAYPLELVARIAATLAANQPTSINATTARRVADEAVILLRACEVALSEIGKPKVPDMLEIIAPLLKDAQADHPEGSFVHGLLRITGRDSETDALPIFKKFLRCQEEKIPFDPRFDMPRPPDYFDKKVDQRIKEYRQIGLGAPTIKYLSEQFASWHKSVHLPKVRRDNGSQGGRGNKKSKTPLLEK